MSLIVLKPTSAKKRLLWVRAKCLFFQNGLLFCGNRGVPFVLALFATKQEKSFLFKNYLIKLTHEERLPQVILV